MGRDDPRNDLKDTRFGRHGGGGPTKLPTDTTGYVCGPDVTDQIAAVWHRIRAEFGKWPAVPKTVSWIQACERACDTVLFPFKKNDPKNPLPTIPFVNSQGDNMGWDTLPLYEGNSYWLEAIPSCCCSPATLSPVDDEDPNTCSHTVQVKGQCWLNGTVNYGTFGIIARLCHDYFPVKYGEALAQAELLVRGYKLMFSKEDATLPVAWLRATYHHGPSGVPPNPSNRPQCQCKCRYDGNVVNWDYVWEPYKPRDGPYAAAKPKLMVPPAPPPTPEAGVPKLMSATTYLVMPGDSLFKIAQAVYGNAALWTKIYQANKAVIGPNPNRIKPGQSLVIP